MHIEIAEVPRVVTAPRFAGDGIRVPLSEQPPPEWLDHLRRQQIPGKAYRVEGAAIEVFLERDTRDIGATMNKIVRAISAANAAYADHGDDDAQRSARDQDEAEARRGRIERLLERWWNEEVQRRERRQQAEQRGAIHEAQEPTADSQ